jgi:hypothetical protein
MYKKPIVYALMYVQMYVCMCTMYKKPIVYALMYVRMYVCMCTMYKKPIVYALMYVRMYVCMWGPKLMTVCIYVCSYVYTYVLTYIRMYVCMCRRKLMTVCIYVCTYIHTLIHTNIHPSIPPWSGRMILLYLSIIHLAFPYGRAGERVESECRFEGFGKVNNNFLCK